MTLFLYFKSLMNWSTDRIAWQGRWCWKLFSIGIPDSAPVSWEIFYTMYETWALVHKLNIYNHFCSSILPSMVL